MTVEDVAKRLIDYGFHAPTMCFPVAGTLMIEPTESEYLAELDRFCDAMIAIRDEIDRVERGEWPHEDSPLAAAPTPPPTWWSTSGTGRTPGARGLPGRRVSTPTKYWPPVSRIDSAYGDRNVVCSCAPIEAHADS